MKDPFGIHKNQCNEFINSINPRQHLTQTFFKVNAFNSSVNLDLSVETTVLNSTARSNDLRVETTVLNSTARSNDLSVETTVLNSTARSNDLSVEITVLNQSQPRPSTAPCLRVGEWSFEGLYDKSVSLIPNTDEKLKFVKKKIN